MVYIWIRATVDWADEEAFLAQLVPKFRPKVELWNETFNIPFHAFRHEVGRIAELSRSRVEGSVPADWDEIPGGALVLPCDDDDWFASDVASVLEQEHDARMAGYHWTSSFVEVPMHLGHRLYLVRRRLVPWWRPKFVLTTNNYALPKTPQTEELLRRHVRASQWFVAGGGKSMKRIDRRLSVMNRTLASTTSLGGGDPRLTRAMLIRKFRRYRRLYRRRVPHELAWCRPYVAMMADLMERLEVREPPPSR